MSNEEFINSQRTRHSDGTYPKSISRMTPVPPPADLFACSEDFVQPRPKIKIMLVGMAGGLASTGLAVAGLLQKMQELGDVEVTIHSAGGLASTGLAVAGLLQKMQELGDVEVTIHSAGGEADSSAASILAFSRVAVTAEDPFSDQGIKALNEAEAILKQVHVAQAAELPKPDKVAFRSQYMGRQKYHSKKI